jgi:hypothetical protein
MAVVTGLIMDSVFVVTPHVSPLPAEMLELGLTHVGAAAPLDCRIWLDTPRSDVPRVVLSDQYATPPAVPVMAVMAAAALPLTTPVRLEAPVPPCGTRSCGRDDMTPPMSFTTTWLAVPSTSDGLGMLFVESPAPLPLNCVPAVTEPGKDTVLIAIRKFFWV